MSHRRYCHLCRSDHYEGIAHDCQGERCPTCSHPRVLGERPCCQPTPAGGAR